MMETDDHAIKPGDTVILHLAHNNLIPICVSAGSKTDTRSGTINHNFHLLNSNRSTDQSKALSYGSTIQLQHGGVRALRFSADLWTQCLPHRTQILYSADISRIVLELDLRPGCIVLEAGTGSGSLSHSIIQAICPTGHLYTFDFHEQRVQLAEKEFRAHAHGVGGVASVAQRDVCAAGFPDELRGAANAVMLDLPTPALAVPHALAALMPGGRLCTFTPAIEQAHAVREALSRFRCGEVRTFECIRRPLLVVRPNERRGDGGRRGRKRPPGTQDSTPEAVDTLTDSVSVPFAVPATECPGHSGYLTFATFLGPEK